jgi:uncharacterized coiled-coil protein SlyX
VHERESLIARIRQLRRVPDPEKSVRATSERPDESRIDALEARLHHLEQLVEGLQDSVHRETQRHGKLIDDLQERVEPGAMGAALSKDARDRGL